METENCKIKTYIRQQAALNGIPYSRRGRTDFPVMCINSTPIRVLDGPSRPKVRGRGYWKTGFRNHGFQKILYTPSTLRVEVGLDWIGGPRVETVHDWTALSPASPYNNEDTHE